jgi:hypothetical protein
VDDGRGILVGDQETGLLFLPKVPAGSALNNANNLNRASDLL